MGKIQIQRVNITGGGGGGGFIGFATGFYIILQYKTLHCPWDLVVSCFQLCKL